MWTHFKMLEGLGRATERGAREPPLAVSLSAVMSVLRVMDGLVLPGGQLAARNPTSPRGAHCPSQVFAPLMIWEPVFLLLRPSAAEKAKQTCSN